MSIDLGGWILVEIFDHFSLIVFQKQRLANKKQALKKQEKSLPSTLALTGLNTNEK